MSTENPPPQPGGPHPPQPGGPTNRQLGILAVAALVVVIVAVVVIIVATDGSTTKPQPSAAATTSTTTTATSVPSATGTVAHPITTATTGTATSPTSTASGGPLLPAGGPVPSGFDADSFTAVSDELWWVMGSAPCSSPPCTSIARSAGGGHSWVGIPAPRSSAVSQLRFSDQRDGYAYGPDALYSTHNGGASWTPVGVSGDINSLAASGGDVYVATSRGLLRSGTTSDAFTQIASGDIASVSAQGAAVYADQQSSAGTPTLLVSTDNGDSFQSHAAPRGVIQCGFDSTGSAVIWASCATGTEGGVWRSPDGSSEWNDVSPPGEAESNSAAFAAASADTAVTGTTQLKRTTDGGVTWSPIPGFPASGQTVAYLGFTDSSHGVAILTAGDSSADKLYVTDDGGASYQPVSIAAG